MSRTWNTRIERNPPTPKILLSLVPCIIKHLTKWNAIACQLFYIPSVAISTISFSFRLIRHSSPNTTQSIPVTAFLWSPVHCAFSPKLSVQFHVVQYGPVQPAPFLPAGPSHHLKTSADSRYQYNSHMDGKAWWKKGPTLHWVFSSLPLGCILGTDQLEDADVRPVSKILCGLVKP